MGKESSSEMKKIGLEKIIFGGLLAALIALRLTAPSMTEAQAATYGTYGTSSSDRASGTGTIAYVIESSSSGSTVYANTGSNDTISEKVFYALKDKKDVTVNIKTESGIEWEFNSNDLKSALSSDDISLAVSAKSLSVDEKKAADELGDGEAVVLNFIHDGTLPGKATIRVPGSNLSSLGTSKDICVYYYNPNTSKLETIAEGCTISHGYLEFDITHCSDYVIKVVEGSTKDDDDDDDDHHETHTTASWIKNPNEKPALVMTGVSLPAGTSLGWAEQGDLGKLAFKAATPAGWTEAFSFNMLTNGKPEYTLKSGTMTLIIPSSYQKANRTYAVLAIDQSGAVYNYPDIDTKANTVTVNINVTGYAFDLIYTE